MTNIYKNFKSLQDLENTLKTEEDCIKLLEDLIWEGVPVSPFDIDSKVYKCANSQYKCIFREFLHA